MNKNEKFVITINRELGSGGRTVGRLLAEKLGVPFYDKAVIKTLQEKYNISPEEIERLKGRKHSWWADVERILKIDSGMSMNYYLPQTLKILENYAKLEAQGIEGENIAEAKAKIEGTMDKVVDGYETQLDKLFANDVLDISADLKVMEQMMEKDGLAVENELNF